MKARKILVSLAALALVAAISIGGTLAYLTSQDQVTNTFTVGNIKITLDEALVNQDGKEGKLDANKNFQPVDDIKDADRVQENTYKLMPGHTYTKDPTIHVEANSENSYIFVKVENGISNLEAAGETKIAKQLEKNGWEPLMNGDKAVENVYVYTANYTQSKDKVDLKVFGSFTLADDAETNATTTTTVDGETVTSYDYQGATITVTAYAVQMDGFETAYEAWAAAKF